MKITGKSRRGFLQSTACLFAASAPYTRAASTEPNVLGPWPDYSPQIGTLVSEMTWMRTKVVRTVKGLTTEQLDYLLDDKANRIGALLLHLAATERIYQLMTFENVPLKEVTDHALFKDWKTPMELGETARKAIKGNNLEYYLNALEEARGKSLSEFRKRDDKWLLAVDKNWVWGPTNNLCKWFHVCEHESHHNGQISLIKGRTPGAKAETG
jgi:uncharacterized damage-inducible protein DinB